MPTNLPELDRIKDAIKKCRSVLKRTTAYAPELAQVAHDTLVIAISLPHYDTPLSESDAKRLARASRTALKLAEEVWSKAAAHADYIERQFERGRNLHLSEED